MAPPPEATTSGPRSGVWFPMRAPAGYQGRTEGLRLVHPPQSQLAAPRADSRRAHDALLLTSSNSAASENRGQNASPAESSQRSSPLGDRLKHHFSIAVKRVLRSKLQTHPLLKTWEWLRSLSSYLLICPSACGKRLLSPLPAKKANLHPSLSDMKV